MNKYLFEATAFVVIGPPRRLAGTALEQRAAADPDRDERGIGAGHNADRHIRPERSENGTRTS